MSTCAVLYASQHGQTRAIVERFAARALAAGHEVHLATLDEHEAVPDVDLLVLASGVYSNEHHPDLVAYVRAHGDTLAGRATALISVSLAAARTDDVGEAMALDYVGQLSDLTGFYPGHVATVAGSLDTSRYDPATRALLKVATWHRGLDLDLSADTTLTDWDQVDGLVDQWL